ncbi:MAG: CHAT domain-containing protein [Gammaproteobacteria bacterium]|nr:CHAT domain-containing protein [Gammaproteobacteria bacterium]
MLQCIAHWKTLMQIIFGLHTNNSTCFGGLLLFISPILHAEVVLDGTLGPAGPLPGPGFAVEADLGRQMGGNLFHSFETFNLHADESATFSGPDSVENVISRVIGGEVSQLDGALRCTIPAADMYFLNPAGVMFGPNAHLDIQGSLYVSTADYLRLGENGRFSAAHPRQKSTLTMAPPAAFGFPHNSSAGIRGENAVLTAAPGKTIAFTGGEINLQDSVLHAPAGQINLVSIASDGEAPINPENLPDSLRFGAVTIADTTSGADNLNRTIANVDVSGPRSGKVIIRGGRIFLDNGYLYADTTGQGNGRGVTVEADGELLLSRGARITSEILNAEDSRAAGSAGDINVTAEKLTLREGAQIAATSSAPGVGGNITVSAKKSIEISGHFVIPADNGATVYGSGILSNAADTGNGGLVSISAPEVVVQKNGFIRADSRGLGDAGNIMLQADTLVLREGGQIDLSAGEQRATAGTGRGGALTINAARKVRITGETDNARPSALLNNVFNAGKGGMIAISTPLLEIEDKGTIQAATRGVGNAGGIVLEVDSLHIRGQGYVITNTARGSGRAGDMEIKASQAMIVSGNNPQARGSVLSETFGSGDAGQISIATPRLILQDGAWIKSATAGSGTGGTITIDADELALSDGAKVSAAAEGLKGRGGDVDIRTNRARLHGGSLVTTESRSRGEAGRIRMRVEDFLRMQGGSGIKTSTLRADGGNVEIASSGYLYLSDSEISTSVQAEKGNGGNIELTPEFVVLDGSRIKADASKGKGGNVAVTASGVYNFSGEPIEAVITASSQFGLDGTVTIDAPDVNVIEGEILPASFLRVRALLRHRCGIYTEAEPSRFVAGAYAGDRKNPDDWQASRFLPAASGGTAAGLRMTRPEACELLLRLPAEQKKTPSQQALMHSYLGDLFLAAHQADTARKHLGKGLAIARKLNNPRISAHLLNNLGNVLSVQKADVKAENVLAIEKAYAEAEKAYTQATGLAERAGDMRLRIHSLSNRARLSIFSKKERAAAAALNEALPLARSLPDGNVKNFYLLNLGELAFRVHKNFPESQMLLRAHQALTEVYDNVQKSSADEKRLMSYARGYLGQVYAHEQRYAEALLLTREAIFFAQELPGLLYRWESQRGRLLREKGDLKGATAAYSLAIAHLQPVRGQLDIGRRDTRTMFSEHIRPVYFSLADLLLQQARSASGKNKQRLLNQARDTLEQLKAAELEDYFQDDCVSRVRARVTKLEDRMDEHTAVLYPVVFPERIELLLSLPDGIIYQAMTQVKAEILEKEVVAFRENLERQQRFTPQARKLYKWLIKPIHGMLAERNINTLTVVPDGPLRMMPLAALHDGKEKFLIEEFALAITPGLELTDPRRLPGRDIKVLLNGLSKSVQDFPPLPYASREIEGLKALFKNAVTLFNKRFTLNNINQTLKTAPYSIVHIASHAQFDRHPQKTFLLAYDDKLTMDRLEQLLRPSRFRDKPVELLTLSACQTSVGDERAALGLAGIAIKAGVRSAVASLWSVNDEATSHLMLEFYRQLQNHDLSKAKALQNAQRKLLQDYGDPFYWAPFLLIGNWL